MKTLIFPSEFTTNKGGVPQSTISLVNGLAMSSEFRIIVVCPKDSEMSSYSFPNNVTVLKTRLSDWVMSRQQVVKTIYTILDLYLTIKKYTGKNTWFVTNQPSTSSLLELMPLKKYNEIYINRGGNFDDDGMASRLIKNKIKKNRITYAIGISNRQVNMLINSGIPSSRVFLVHNGLAVPSLSYSYNPLNRNLVRISTIGYISDLKNQIEGVKLIKLCRDNGIQAILNMYGIPDADLEYQVKLSNLIKELALEDYIRYCGFVSGEDLYKDTDILISFSKTEGFGRSLVEGMLRKLPIIAWRGAGGPIDITDDGKYGHLVNNNDASEYFNTIKKLIDNPTENKVNIELSYDYANNNFTEEIMVEKYIKLFKKICL